MKVIAFVGMPASGKSEASRVASEMGIPVVVMGDVIRSEVRRRGLEMSDENAGMTGNKLREEEDIDAIAKRCVPLIEKYRGKSPLVVVDGVRGIAEANLFKDAFKDCFKLIRVDSDDELRYKRTLNRCRSDAVDSYESFLARDNREIGWGMGEAMNAADECISNDGVLDDFRSEIGRIFDNAIKPDG